MSPLRRHLRHLRRWLAYGLAVLLIVAAVLVGVANQLLPLLERHPERVAGWLSERVGQPVRFERLHAGWTRRGPLLGLERLEIGAGAEALRIERAELLVAIYSGLVPGLPLTELRLHGLALDLERDDEGRWRARGLTGETRPDGDPLGTLEGFGEIQVRAARLRVSAPSLGIGHTVPRIDLRLRSSGGRLRAGLLGWAGQAPPLQAVFELDRARGDGRLFIGGNDLQLAEWAPLLGWGGVELRDGRGRLGFWLDLRGQRVVAVQAEAELEQVALRGRTPIPLAGEDAGVIEPRAGFDRVDVALRWQAGEDGWRLHAPRLRLDHGGEAMTLDGLYAAGGDGFGLAAEGIEANPLLALAALSDKLSPEQRRWLYFAAPRGRIEALRFARAGGRFRGEVRLRGFGWLPTGQQPALQGLGGELHFDQDGAEFALDEGLVRFDWPLGFVAPLEVNLEGTLALWREDGDWRVGSDRLRIVGEDYAATARGELRFGGEGRRPRLDLAATVDAGPATASKRFWVLHEMPEAAVEWLNAAIEGGRVAHGEVVLSGDLDDWPFRGNQGRFEAVAHIEDIALRFRPDWPHAQKLGGIARFTGTGFSLQGHGELAGVAIGRVDGGIDDYRAPLLHLRVEGEGSGAQLLGVLRQSPLRARYGEHIEALQIGGRGKVALELAIPLRAGLGETRLRGTVDLADARLADPRWNLDFSRASGRVRFSEDGFAAEELSVRLDEEVGSLSLAVGGFTSTPELAAEASLRGRFPVSALTMRYPALDWLAPAMPGRADWTVSLRIPAAPDDGEAPPPRLRVRSNLIGIALEFPAPLRKGVDDALVLTVDTPLPVEAGELRVSLGQLMHLRGRMRESGALDGVLAFGHAAEPPGEEPGLLITGQVPVMDIAGWAALASEGEGAMRIRAIDVSAGELDLLDRAFVDTRLRMERDSERMRLRVDGPELDGWLEIPSDLDRGIVGEFARLHWPSGRPARGATYDGDPAGVPPLRLSVEDLRFGEAQLGRARLETYPTPEGLHVQRFEAEAPTQRITAGGHWGRIGGQSYSRFSVDFRADSLGQMLSALGFAGMVEGGRTQARLIAGWPGSPAAFGLEIVEGSLEIDVGQGRILEVEPGAGRLLGLVSLAELPRRLILDFSDFFGQGLSFNRIRGSFVLGGGDAVTDDLLVDGPAAEIRVRGRAGLKAQDYDQTIEVLPKTGGVLPVVGALTGGPAGAAIGAVAQAILNRPFKEISRTVYHVTGAWKSPQVEVIERGPPKQPVTEEDGAGPE
ncbi:YhdP family protein [Rehaibacterium terrae]|jgi:uncharacterized protein (TIGR02099 family)|uniref:Uncharacterized protein (TIGR02099 family) n=1 Tax=Rehaibacterium terrae TaxID=1341696 RepID=A0A7W7Y0N2_9GAMM|nr:YhdP family protein [Rehaibacterium terrae]MBB5015718.1 uncharacterized protein (TIGR02099 family) [Rehaibacterium terrae]